MAHSGIAGLEIHTRRALRAGRHAAALRTRYEPASRPWAVIGFAAVACGAGTGPGVAQAAATAGGASASPVQADASTLPGIPPLASPAAGGGKRAHVAVAQVEKIQVNTRNGSQTEASPGNRANTYGVSPYPSQNTTGNSAQETAGPPTPISPVPHVGLFPDVGRRLLEAGFDFHGLSFDRAQTNTSAGVIRHQFDNLVAIAPILDVDLGKVAGITGGNLHVSATFNILRANEPNFVTNVASELVGNLQGTPSLSGHFFYLSELTYEQRLLAQRLSIEFGQTSVFRYFFLPNSLDPITYYSTTETVDADFPTTPFPTWGGRATYKISPLWYAQVGAFEDNYLNSTEYPLAFGSDHAAGAQILAEVGYRTEFSNARYPANVEAGVEYNTRSGYFNSKGSPAPDTKALSAADYPGGGVIYAQGLQTLWRGAAQPGSPPPNISFYGSMDLAVDKPQPIDFDTLMGFNFTGLVPGRRFDAIGLQVRYQRLSNLEAAFETRAHDFFAGRGPSQKPDGFAFEAIYSLQVTPAVSFRPLAEYFINPDNIGNPRAGRSHSGAEFGLFTLVSLGRLFGTSVKPF